MIYGLAACFLPYRSSSLEDDSVRRSVASSVGLIREVLILARRCGGKFGKTSQFGEAEMRSFDLGVELMTGASPSLGGPISSTLCSLASLGS